MILCRLFQNTKNFFISIFITISLPSVGYSQNSDFQDLTIVINSCDKYEELWEPFFKLLFLKWKGLEKGTIPIVLITNTKDFNHPAVRVEKVPNEVSWSDTVKKVFKNIKTRYILYLQEDYFFTGFNEEKLSELYLIMKNNNIGYMQIYGGRQEERVQFQSIKGLYYKNQFEQWRTSLQAAFWEKEVFNRLLSPSEKIWDFEIIGSVRSQGCSEAFTVFMEDAPIKYLNMAAGGVLVVEHLAEIKKLNGIEWQTKLPLSSDFDFKRFFGQKIKDPLYWNIWLPFKNKIKEFIG